MNLAQKIGLSLGAAVLGVGAAFGVTTAASQASTTSTSQQSQVGRTGQPPGHSGTDQSGTEAGPREGEGGVPTQLISGLATKLGIEQTTVQTAVTEAFSQVQASGQQAQQSSSSDTDPREAMDAKLAPIIASKLGVDESKVATALAELRTENPMTGGRTHDQEPPGTAQSGTNG